MFLLRHPWRGGTVAHAYEGTPAELRDGAEAIIALLARRELYVAPRVALRLGLICGSDFEALVQMAERLRLPQRYGHAALPDPLPLVPAIEEAFAGLAARLNPRERHALLVAAISVDDRIEPVLGAMGIRIGELIDGRLCRYLRVVAGHFEFADARVRIWVHSVASLAERTAAHRALAASYAQRRDTALAAWHRALHTLEGDADLARDLLEIAREADAVGDSEWGFAVAREAAEQARLSGDGALASDGQLAAAVIAVNAGFLRDALSFLEAVSDARRDDPVYRAVALRISALADLSAETVRRDSVHHRFFGRRGPRRRDDGFLETLVATQLAAERGDVERARTLWNEIPPERTDSAIVTTMEWCAGLGVPLVDGPAGSLRRGAGDDRDPLVEGLSGLWSATIPLGERMPDLISPMSPLARAMRSNMNALCAMWEGDLPRAQDFIDAAALEAPIELPFFGLGIVLARRLTLLRAGRVDDFAEAIARGYPGTPPLGVRGNVIVDEALQLLWEGKRSDAEALQDLAGRRLAAVTDGWFVVPGLDVEGWRARMPGDARLASHVRGLIAHAEGPADLALALEQCGDIISPLERGHAELALAEAFLESERPADARRAAIVAESLFREADAEPWRVRAQALLRRDAMRSVDDEMDDSGAGGAMRAEVDPLEATRLVWAKVLTERELEVAILVASGASNADVARQLFLSTRTIEAHLRRVFTKLDVRSRHELSLLAYRSEPSSPGISRS